MRELTMQTFIYYLIYSGARETFCKIIQHKKVSPVVQKFTILRNYHNVLNKIFK